MEPLIPHFHAPTISFGQYFSISTPGTLLFVGIMAALLVALRKARQDQLYGMPLVGFVPWLVVGIVIGGHLGHLLFYAPGQLVSDPASLLRVWEGQSSYGGFLACALLGGWYFRWQVRVTGQHDGATPDPDKVWGYFDAVLYGVTLGWFIGRMGCFSIHDHPGVETTFWLGVFGICPSGDPGVACHDLGLYEGLFSLLLFIALTLAERKPRFFGFHVALVCMAYAPVRFLLDILRHPDVDARYFGFTPGQYGSVVLFLFGMWVWSRRSHRQHPNTTPSLGKTPVR